MQLNGVYTASLTPLMADLTIDYPSLIRHNKWLLESGCSGIALLGTTGEANSFSLNERLSLIDAISESDLPKDRIMIGTGCCALPDTVKLSRHALDNGITGLLVLPPFYYKNISDEGLEWYFSDFVEQLGDGDADIILYNFPKLTGVPFSLPLLEKLITQYPSKILGIKDSSGDFDNMRAMCAAFPDFAVFSGTEKYLLDILEAGGAGCISATANITCKYAVEIYRNWQQGLSARKQQQFLTAIRTAMDVYPLIGMLKKMMQIRENKPDWQYIRPPNTQMKDIDYRLLAGQLGKLGFNL